MSMSALEILECATEKLSKPKAWQQGTYFKLSSGIKTNHVGSTEEPIAFCAVGAMLKCTSIDPETGEIDPTVEEAAMALTKAAGISVATIPANAVIAWNDEKGRTKRQVLSAFKKAIKDLKGES